MTTPTLWRPFDPTGAEPPHETILALVGTYLVSAFRYLPSNFTRCIQYEVSVSATNGAWVPAVAMGTWSGDSSEKTASYAPTPGDFVAIGKLNPYCYVAEHNVAGAANLGFEHHESSQALDLDGDRDISSLGWLFRQMHVLENLNDPTN